MCHGDEREGNLPGFPPLLGIKRRMTDDQIADLIHPGKGRMPGFPKLQNAELSSLLHFLAQPVTASQADAGGDRAVEAIGHCGRGRRALSPELRLLPRPRCHGRRKRTRPDAIQAGARDETGEKIAASRPRRRPDNKMPSFNFSSQEIRSIVAFIHARVEAAAKAHPGGRRGVAVADLQTGNAQAGKEYFNGAGGCAKCHSPSGDLAGVANRYQGLQLEERMLYPRDAKSKLTVTLPSGREDRRNAGLPGRVHDRAARQRGDLSLLARRAAFDITVDSPVDAHVEQFRKYTDEDIHNLMAYLQTLR